MNAAALRDGRSPLTALACREGAARAGAEPLATGLILALRSLGALAVAVLAAARRQ